MNPNIYLTSNYLNAQYSTDGLYDFEIKTTILINYCKLNLTPIELNLEHLQLSDIIISDNKEYSIYNFLEDYKNIQDIDLHYPIIMGCNGTIVDGAHRIMKAIINGDKTIQCYKLPKSILELVNTGEIDMNLIRLINEDIFED